MTNPKPIKDYLKTPIADLNSTRVLSGFDDLDSITYGFQKGSLTVIASRPSMGKSAFIDSIAINIGVESNKSVLYYSIEANEQTLMKRLIANISGIELKSLFNGNINEEETKSVENAIAKLSQSPITIQFTPEINIVDLAQSIRMTTASTQIDIIFIDYLQLITAPQYSPPNREQEIGLIVRKLKSLAKEHNLPIVLLSQLNRQSDNRPGSKKPLLIDLRDSGVIEDIADLICFIHRPEYFGMTVDEQGFSTEGIAEVIIAKHRHGKQDSVKFRCEPSLCRFKKYDDGSYLIESSMDLSQSPQTGGSFGFGGDSPF